MVRYFQTETKKRGYPTSTWPMDPPPPHPASYSACGLTNPPDHIILVSECIYNLKLKLLLTLTTAFMAKVLIKLKI